MSPRHPGMASPVKSGDRPTCFPCCLEVINDIWKVDRRLLHRSNLWDEGDPGRKEFALCPPLKGDHVTYLRFYNNPELSQGMPVSQANPSPLVTATSKVNYRDTRGHLDPLSMPPDFRNCFSVPVDGIWLPSHKTIPHVVSCEASTTSTLHLKLFFILACVCAHDCVRGMSVGVYGGVGVHVCPRTHACSCLNVHVEVTEENF